MEAGVNLFVREIELCGGSKEETEQQTPPQQTPPAQTKKKK